MARTSTIEPRGTWNRTSARAGAALLAKYRAVRPTLKGQVSRSALVECHLFPRAEASEQYS